MALTPNNDIYYPDPGDVPQRQDLQDMAMSVDGLFQTFRGNVTVTSGFVNVPHTLGRIPSIILPAIFTSGYRISPVSSGTTSSVVRLEVVNATTGAPYSGGLVVSFLIL